jgi:hypothetical protein
MMEHPMRVTPLLAALLAATLVGCGDREESRTSGEAGQFESDTLDAGEEAVGRSPGESDTGRVIRREIQAKLESAYSELETRLDDIWADSLNVRAGMRTQYRRVIDEANTVKDNTKVFLEELKVSSEGITPEIWESLRARAETSLDSLRALIQAADTLSDTAGAAR